MMSSEPTTDYTAVAVAFVQALTTRDYAAAYAMTSRAYQRATSLEAMQTAFDALVPAEFGSVSSVETGLTMETWPDKQDADAGWVYVSIGGDVYSEAVTVVVTMDDGSLKVRAAEFGRP